MLPEKHGIVRRIYEPPKVICTLFTGHPSEEGNFYALFL